MTADTRDPSEPNLAKRQDTLTSQFGPDSPAAKTKIENGATFLITQLLFDNRHYFDFVPAARAAGIDVPIIAGVMPITSYAQIRRFCEICEASIPTPLAAAMEALNGDERAEFELGVAYAAQQCAELLRGGAPGIHFYALNRWPATRAILSALRAAKQWETSTAATNTTASTAATKTAAGETEPAAIDA